MLLKMILRVRQFKKDVHNTVFKVNMPIVVIASILKYFEVIHVSWMVILWPLIAAVVLLVIMAFITTRL